MKARVLLPHCFAASPIIEVLPKVIGTGKVALSDTVTVTYGAPPGGVGGPDTPGEISRSFQINPPEVQGEVAANTCGWVINGPPAWCASQAAWARDKASLGSGSGFGAQEAQP